MASGRYCQARLRRQIDRLASCFLTFKSGPGRSATVYDGARRSTLHARNESPESVELLGDYLARGLILQRQRLFVELRLRQADEDLGRAEYEGIEKCQGHSQMILHTSAAKRSAGGRLNRDRLVPERLVGEARHPVERVLERARDGPIVFGRNDDDAV